MAVPSVYLNGELFDQGRMSLEQIVGKLDAGSAERAAARIDAKDPFDVLVVGGGPAGAAAAVYAARKGIRTGVVAERFGGQVLDTMAIENFISVPYTEGPKLATALEQHVKDYEVDVMDLQKASRLVPADRAGRPGDRRARERGVAAGPGRRRVDRCPVAPHRRAGRGRVPQQGRHLLPALRRAPVQGQAGRGDRRRQLRRRGRHRPGRRGRPRHADRVRRRRCGPTTCCSASCAAWPTSTCWSARAPPRCSATARRSSASPTRTAPAATCAGSTSTASSCRSACCPTPSG